MRADYLRKIRARNFPQARIVLAAGGGRSSAKMQVLQEIVTDCRAEGHHMLIFMEFTDVLAAAACVVGEDFRW